MASLTDAAQLSREVIKWGFVGLVGLMIGRMIIGGAIAWYKAAHPKISPPTVGFGVIPPVSFPEKELPQLTYTLETATGSLPVFDIQAEVIYIPTQRPNLLAMERSIKDAGNLGFKDEPEKINDVTYRWRNHVPLTSLLTMQIYDGRFTLKADWAANPNFLNERRLPEEDEAIKQAKEVIKRLNPLADDLGYESVKVSFLKGLGGAYQPAVSLSDADFVQVDLYRSPHQEKYAFVTPNPDQGIIRVILSGNAAAKVIQVEYNYMSLDRTRIETYPLKTVEQAWLELQGSKGYIASLDRGVTDVVVRRVELAYYDSFEPQNYAQPVYVFTGDDSFIAYVQAVKDPKVTE